MENRKGTSTYSNALIWFGAGVSIAEIITGTLYASLGFGKAMAAILLGHLIGGVMMVFAGLIGGFEKKSAMETVGLSFGLAGKNFFAAINVIQLIGWTAIMIYDGAISANQVFHTGMWIWALVIGGLILIWVLIGLTNLGKVNTFAMAALFILTLVMAKVVFSNTDVAPVTSVAAISFGGAVELAVAMPLSWLPLISDYTREAEKPVSATIVSVITYCAVSTFMYSIGMGAAIFTGESDISTIMVKAGLGVAGLLIIVISTVTTAFLDVYSAGISAEALSKKLNGKNVSIVVTGIGIAAAIFFKPENITDFLYFIGSVFAPMIAVQIADYFVIGKRECEKSICIPAFIAWIIGFGAYRYLMRLDTPVGITIVDMVITVFAVVIINALCKKRK